MDSRQVRVKAKVAIAAILAEFEARVGALKRPARERLLTILLKRIDEGKGPWGYRDEAIEGEEHESPRIIVPH